MELEPVNHKMTPTSSNPLVGKKVLGRVRHAGNRYTPALGASAIEVAAVRPRRARKQRGRVETARNGRHELYYEWQAQSWR
eukprot:516872-Pyramimonas_sp.AAC.1